MGKKLLSLCMALVLCLSLLPVTALAATVENITYELIGDVESKTYKLEGEDEE